MFQISGLSSFIWSDRPNVKQSLKPQGHSIASFRFMLKANVVCTRSLVTIL